MLHGGIKMYIRKLAISLSVGFMIIGSFVQGECADWKLFYMVSEGPKYYFDKESIVHSQKDIIQVWFKSMLEDGSIETMQYSAHVEINCKSRSHRILEESMSDNANKEEKDQQPSADQSVRRFSIESVLGSLWTNVCPGR